MPRPFTRYVNVEFLSQADELLETAEEACVWTQLQICEDTTLAGFFRPQLMLLASRSRTSISTVAATLAKLDGAEIIVFDRGWLFIPGYFEQQKGTRIPRWEPATRNVANDFLELGGDPSNRAYLAFREYRTFRGVFSSGPPHDPPKQPDDDPSERRKPRPAQQGVLRPSFDDFLDVVRSTTSGAGRKHPRPKEKAEALYHWFEHSKIGWTDEWPRLAAGFVIKDLGKELGDGREDDVDDDESGRALPGGARLAI